MSDPKQPHMKPQHSVSSLISLGFVLAAGALLLPPNVSLAEKATPSPSEQITIKFPENYRTTFTHYQSVDRANPKQIGELYANSVAINSLKSGDKFANGSVLIMEIYNAKLDKDGTPILNDKGRRIKAGLKVIAVREKQPGWGAKWPEDVRNEDWDSIFFSPKSKQPLKKDYTACQECHKPLTDADYTFSYEVLKSRSEQPTP